MRSHFIALLAIVLPGAALADSMRCDKWVVDETVSVAELKQKCGEPSSKDVATEDVYAPNVTSGTRKVGTKVTERWVYRRGTQSLPMLVTIIDGKINRIERTE